MHIDGLTLKNFRCFDDVKLTFNPNFHVLMGKNGTGKTAILEALAIALDRWLQGTGYSVSRNMRQRDVRLRGRQVGDASTFEPQYPAGVCVTGGVSGERFISARGLKNPASKRPTGFIVFIQGRANYRDLHSLAEAEAEQVRAGEMRTLPVIAYFGAGRLWLPSSKPDSDKPVTQWELSRLEGYRDALIARSHAGELHRWLEYQDRIAYQQRAASPLYRTVLDAMCSMLPEASEVKFDATRLEVVITSDQDSLVPFGLLSDGQRNMLAMAGDIAMRMVRLNPQFGTETLKETPGIVLIDELDLHLHPEWQRIIAHSLSRTFPKVQFIATTHSPQILSEIKADQIMMLDAQGHPDRPFQSYGMDSNFILRHLMHVTDRPQEIATRLHEIEELIKREQYTSAEARIDTLRAEVGEFAELVRLQTRIDRIQILSK